MAPRRQVTIKQIDDDNGMPEMAIPEGMLDDSFEDVEQEEPDHVVVAPPVQRRPVPQQKTFYATLLTGNSYSSHGMKFHHMIPKEVPMNLYDKFKTNGWFGVSMTAPAVQAPRTRPRR